MKLWNWLKGLLEMRDDDLPKEPVDVVIAVGIDITGGTLEAGPYSEQVALEALKILKQNKARNILLSGGCLSDGKVSRAVAMAHMINEQVPITKLFIEIKSRRGTWQSAKHTLEMMRDNGWQSAIVVVCGWYARLARFTFRKCWQGSGIKFAVIKARSAYGGESFKSLAHFCYFLIWDIWTFIVSRFRGLLLVERRRL